MRVPLLFALVLVPTCHLLYSNAGGSCGGLCVTLTDRAGESANGAPATIAIAAGRQLAPAETAEFQKPSRDAHNRLTREEVEAGWIKLFDGSTLFGWQANNDVNWSVANGVIQADQGEPGLLLTTVPFANYELRCDYRLEIGGNSGVFLRTQFEPGSVKTDCYELNMCDTHDSFPTGSLVGRHKADAAVMHEGSWQSFIVTVEGRRIRARLDGTPVLDYTDPEGTPESGFIGLQKNAGRIEFRNVYLRPLGMSSLFNGKDLTGWQLVPGSQSRFEVQDRTIHVAGGRGYLETKETWGDFVLQADVISNGAHLNSGIFFRAIKGTESNPSDGYECQIQNGFLNGDRTKPMDYGTGAIMHRSKARMVVPDDHEWFTMTLVAQGPRYACWVNGEQVTDWVDERPEHDNPRKGRRLKAGHISLQGHDDTTNLAFRNLRIRGTPAVLGVGLR